MSATEKSPTPWWKTGLAVGLATVILPLATFIQGSLQSERELSLQQQKQMQELRLAYVNLMVEGGVERVALLADFLAETEEDPKMQSWARKQQVVIQEQKKAIEENNAAAQAQALAAQASQAEAERKLAEANAELTRLKQVEQTKLAEQQVLVDRIKNGEVSQLLAAAAKQKELKEQLEQERAKQAAAEKLAREQAAAVAAAQANAAQANAKSVKSQELLTGRIPVPQVYREQQMLRDIPQQMALPMR